MNITPPQQQRLVARPESAGPQMPQALRVPRIPLPGPTHRGTSLGRLPIPVAPGSIDAQRDLAITHALVQQRTHEGDSWARAMDLHGATAIWRELASHIQGDQPAIQTLIGAALSAASTQSGIGKKRWQRLRPFQVDPTIDVIGRTPRGGDSSYPSGHSARAYAAARIIATLDPSLTSQAYDMAREVAISRVYAGVHFATDVVAGARLGTLLAEGVLRRHAAVTSASRGHAAATTEPRRVAAA